MKVEVDILSEPSDLIFQKNDNEVKLIYKNSSLLIYNYDEAISKLKDVIKLLFKELEHIPNWKDDLALTELIKFIE